MIFKSFVLGLYLFPGVAMLFFFGKRLSHDWDSKTNFPMGEGACLFFLKKEAAAAFASVTANCRENKKDV